VDVFCVVGVNAGTNRWACSEWKLLVIARAQLVGSLVGALFLIEFGHH
jgi:hypothetical protein